MQHKRLVNNVVCPCCERGAETIDNLFCDCPISVEVWSELKLSNILNRPELVFAQWLTLVFRVCSTHQRRIFYCVLWALWRDKNVRLHERKISTEMKIARFIINHIIELIETKRRDLTKRYEVVKWRGPTGSIIKINFDGAYDGCSFRSTSGIIVRNVEG